MKVKLLPTFLLCFCLLTIISVGSVIAIQHWSGKQLISNLGGRIVARNLQAIKFELDSFINASRNHISSIARHLQHDEMENANPDELNAFIKGIMTADPNVVNITVLDMDLNGITASRAPGDAEPKFRTLHSNEPSSLQRTIADGHLRASAFHLSQPWHDPQSAQTVVTQSREISRDGTAIGFVEVAVAVEPLSAMAKAMSGSTQNIIFALLDGRYVLAHPLLARSPVGLSKDAALPQRDELGDGVLSVLETAIASPLVEKGVLDGASLQNVNWRGNDYLLSTLPLRHRFGEHTVVVGSYRRSAEARVPLQVFFRSMWFAGGILLLALIAAAILARRISHPIQRISEAAAEVGQVEFNKIKPLGGSFIKELHELSNSFNSMVGGLKLFERYVPRALVAKLIERGDAGSPPEERVVTVMFTDIAGFTTLSEGMSAGQVAEFTNEHLTLLGRCVEDQGGTIDKYIGDSLMAFWGAPDDMADHAQAACRAAIAIANDLHEDNQRRLERGLAPVRIRIGIHTGPLVVGDIGSPNRINYTIMGDTVNVAARLEALGKEIDKDAEIIILTGSETASRAGDEFTIRQEGAHTIRGKSEATNVCRLLP